LIATIIKTESATNLYWLVYPGILMIQSTNIQRG